MPKSVYFSETFGTPDEDQKLVLDLPEDDPDLMDVFLRYIYWPRIVLAPESDAVDLEVRLSVLSQLYILGDRFGILHLQAKTTVEAFELLCTETDDDIMCKDNKGFLDDLDIRLETIGEVYRKTSCDEDPLRKLLVTDMARHWGCYSRRGMAAGDDGSESELSKFTEEVPRFTKDLLWYLQNAESTDFGPPGRTTLVRKRRCSQ